MTYSETATPTNEELHKQIENLYALTGVGKWEEVEAQLTDDFKIIEADSLPYAGLYEGKKALQELYTKVFAFWDDPSLAIHDITISKKNVIGMLSVHATSKHNGERLEMKVCEVFHIRGNMISGITPYYFDTAMIAKATGIL